MEPERLIEQLSSPDIQKLLRKIADSYDLDKHDISRAVEVYYDAQKLRIMHANKQRSEDPRDITEWFAFWLGLGEKVIETKLKRWIKSEHAPAEAKWAFDQVGVGPVIAAGLASYIDIERASTVSSLWKYAGLAPGSDHPQKGHKLPYNARLKTLCWKIGESWVKVSGKETATYGKLWAQFKAEEIRKNDAGLYKAVAEQELAKKKWSDNQTKARLLEGKLSDGHLHARAKRKATKIFLSHYWLTGREARGLEVRDPYSIQILGHDGIIKKAA